jgi:hypothetical protein
MEIAFLPGLAFEICDLLWQSIAEPAGLDRHGNAGG